VSRTLRCRRCLAVGLSFSALLHGATALWLSGRPADAPPSETRVMELDLAMFAAAEQTTESAGGDTVGTPELNQDPVAAAPETPTVPPPETRPQIDSAETQDTSEPEPEPEPAHIAEPKLPPPTADPPPATLAKVEPAPKPVLKPRPKSRAQLKRPQKKPKPKAIPKTAPAPIPDRKTEDRSRRLARADSAGSPVASNRPGSSGNTDKASRSASASGGGSTPGSNAKRDAEHAYLAQLQRAIGRYQRFPDDARKRRRTGVVTVAFVVMADGRIREVKLHSSSGDSSLDKAALQALHRLNRFKPIPASIGRQSWPMRVPIRFDLR